MKISILVVCLLFVSSGIIAQPCNTSFSTQSEIDSFSINYPGCTESSAILMIEGENITNLLGLENLTGAWSVQITDNPRLKSLEGLENLSVVEKGFVIARNDSILNLTGLEGLQELKGSLFIDNNELLENLKGLDNLNKIGDYLRVHYNDNIKNFEGLNSLDTIIGDLGINENELLETLEGLENLKFIGEDFEVDANPELVNFNPLINLNYVGEDLTFRKNNQYTDFRGLENLKSIGGNLSIVANNELISLIGLENIDYNTITRLDIYSNFQLNTCDVKSICDFIDYSTGVVNVYNNKSGCSNEEEIEIACSITGLNGTNNKSSFHVFPNPVTGTIHFQGEYSLPYSIKIFNYLGEMVFKVENIDNKNLDISNISKGNYILELITENETKKIQIIKL